MTTRFENLIFLQEVITLGVVKFGKPSSYVVTHTVTVLLKVAMK